MERRYMVVGYGTSKKTGEIYTRANRIREDEKNRTFGYLDEKDQYYLESETRPLGTIIKINMTEE